MEKVSHSTDLHTQAHWGLPILSLTIKAPGCLGGGLPSLSSKQMSQKSCESTAELTECREEISRFHMHTHRWEAEDLSASSCEPNVTCNIHITLRTSRLTNHNGQTVKLRLKIVSHLETVLRQFSLCLGLEAVASVTDSLSHLHCLKHL